MSALHCYEVHAEAGNLLEHGVPTVDTIEQTWLAILVRYPAGTRMSTCLVTMNDVPTCGGTS